MNFKISADENVILNVKFYLENLSLINIMIVHKIVKLTQTFLSLVLFPQFFQRKGI